MDKVEDEVHSTQNVEKLCKVLLGGGVAVVPTDTVYGLAALPSHDRAIDKVFELKARPRTRNLPIMVAGASDMVSLGCVVNSKVERLLGSPFVPGALTMAVEVDPTRAASWLAHRDEVAVRIPNYNLLLETIRRVGPLLVTSANRHTEPTQSNLADVLAQLEGTPEMSIDGGVIDFVPSTLVNCRTEPATIEREGKIPAEVVLGYLDN